MKYEIRRMGADSRIIPLLSCASHPSFAIQRFGECIRHPSFSFSIFHTSSLIFHFPFSIFHFP
jgi:hypothetical protein